MALFDILVNIAANTAKLESGLQQATAKLDDFAAGAEKAFTRIAQFAGVGLSIDAIATSIKHAVDTGDQLQLLSERMGTSVATLSRLQFAAALTDVPVEALTSSLDHFHQILTRAELGTGRAGKAIAAMGIDANKLLNLPLSEQLEAIADKLSKIENPAKRAGLEMILFGAEGAKLDPLFRKGAEGIRALEEEADKAGVTLDGSMTQKLKETHEALVQMEAAMHSAWISIATELAPAIQKLAGWLSGAVQGIRGFGEALAHYFGGADTLVGQLTDKLNALSGQSLQIGEDIRKLEDRSTGFLGYPGQFNTQIAAKKQQLAVIAAEIQRVSAQLDAAQKDAQAAEAAAKSTRGGADISKAAPSGLSEIKINAQKIYGDKMKALYDQFNKDTETSVEQTVAAFDKEEAELNELRAQGLINQEEYAKRIREILDRYLPGVDVTAKRIKTKVKAETDEMQQLGEKAAASIQGAFANFLFDPFHGGLKRMGIEFLQILQKMAAEAAAAQIFKALFGGGDSAKGGGGGLGGILGSVLGALFGGGRAEGGLVSAGSSYLVGEEGPELFTASSHGQITPLTDLQGGAAASININNHIDARGADADRIMTVLPPLIAQHGARVKADILHAFRRSGLAAPVRA